jgi:hypothetical protein
VWYGGVVQMVFIFMNDSGSIFSPIASMIRGRCVHCDVCSLMQRDNRRQA